MVLDKLSVSLNLIAGNSVKVNISSVLLRTFPFWRMFSSNALISMWYSESRKSGVITKLLLPTKITLDSSLTILNFNWFEYT